MPNPPGYDKTVAELLRLGFKLQAGMWRCGSVRAIDDKNLREFITLHGSDAGGVMLAQIPIPSPIDRLAQITEETT